MASKFTIIQYIFLNIFYFLGVKGTQGLSMTKDSI